MAVEVQKEGRKKAKGGQSGKKADGGGGGGVEKRVTPKSEDFSRCAAPPATQSRVHAVFCVP